MFEPIFTTISALNRVYDKHNQMLPPGNYYYEIIGYSNGYFRGNISCKGDYGVFILRAKDVVKMMAVAQARLGRIVNKDNDLFFGDKFPKYSSPRTSPVVRSNLVETLNRYSNFQNEVNQIVADIEKETVGETIGKQPVGETIGKQPVGETGGKQPVGETIGKQSVDETPKDEIQPDECSICLTTVGEFHQKILSCSHIFHWHCIKEWIKESKTCPVCRNPMNRQDQVNYYMSTARNKNKRIKRKKKEKRHRSSSSNRSSSNRSSSNRSRSSSSSSSIRDRNRSNLRGRRGSRASNINVNVNENRQISIYSSYSNLIQDLSGVDFNL